MKHFLAFVLVVVVLLLCGCGQSDREHSFPEVPGASYIRAGDKLSASTLHQMLLLHSTVLDGQYGARDRGLYYMIWTDQANVVTSITGYADK